MRTRFRTKTKTSSSSPRFCSARRFGGENFLTNSSCQLSILDPVGCLSRGAETCFAIGFVVGIVALKPEHLAVTLKRENVSRDAIEEPAVVRDDHRTAGEVF